MAAVDDSADFISVQSVLGGANRRGSSSISGGGFWCKLRGRIYVSQYVDLGGDESW